MSSRADSSESELSCNVGSWRGMGYFSMFSRQVEEVESEECGVGGDMEVNIKSKVYK